MLAELGQLAIALALCLALVQAAAFSRPVAAAFLARGQFVFLAAALVLLAVLFALDDFSVAYIANNSNTNLPLRYKLSAVWGGHEGSMLLWVFMLALWTCAVSFSRQMPDVLRARVVAVLGGISTGFLAFVLLTSSPFARLIPAATEGRDLNPLLQDPGLIFHPPMLYMGYVGFSVAFAFAVAALAGAKMDVQWAKFARPWVLAAWIFLTLGITLGSWWAYYELGWGGWWFWDPVENASFMPWLAGTALLHSIAATESRGVFRPWTALLAVLTFSLCLLGAFLVRSGVLTSVHSFAADPARGAFILALTAAAVAGALILYARRAHLLGGGGGRFAPLSRETGILLNNIFLSAATFAVLLGTLYPLILDALGGGKISVGPPYFNAVFAPLASIAAALSVFGAVCYWKSDKLSRIAGKLSPVFIAAVVVGGLLPFVFDENYNYAAAAGLILSCWIFFGTLRAAASGDINKGGGFWGMITAHFGIGVFVLGVTLVGAYQSERDVKMIFGEEVKLGKMVFVLQSVSEERGENYRALVGDIIVAKDGKTIARLRPEKRFYDASPKTALTEAGIAAKADGDLYASLGAQLESNAWSARLQIKPFIRLIWGGALLMALGALIATTTRRRKKE
ncbi:MAG: heme lyase CcmF/NrfE family subunit [Gammaproteobacteria bacterium]